MHYHIDEMVPGNDQGGLGIPFDQIRDRSFSIYFMGKRPLKRKISLVIQVLLDLEERSRRIIKWNCWKWTVMEMSDLMDARRKILIIAIFWTIFCGLITLEMGTFTNYIFLLIIALFIQWVPKKIVGKVTTLKCRE